MTLSASLKNRLFWMFIFGALLLCSILLPLQACSVPLETIPLLEKSTTRIAVVYGNGASAGIEDAAKELARSLGHITKTKVAAQKVAPKTALSSIQGDVVFIVGLGVLDTDAISSIEEDKLGEEGSLQFGRRSGGKVILQVAGETTVGTQYGVYGLLRQLGVRYFHPKDTYTPVNTKVTITLGEKKIEKPSFAVRGFHHHTQHPIPMSVYLLEPEEKHLKEVKIYVQWLARNRQNLLQWHFLKTVDQAKWLPYIKKVRDLAKPYGVKLGLTISFADQQQNNYRLVTDLNTTKEEQVKAIHKGLDSLIPAGFGQFVIQFGTSEFTKVKDEVALNWLNTAAKYLKSKNIPVYAWIHTAGELKADDEKSYFYHLPEKADSAMGAYVHTTMFYDMKHPAPVYSNENFHHQNAFLKRIVGKRKVIYFPETAWWLGFDNNLPLALPITGYSRAYDILDILSKHPKDIEGHVTFTSGMEWGYWKYDHYLTQVTWDRKTTWDAYIKDFAAIFGSQKDTVAEVLMGWSKQQAKDFYETNPLLYFAIAGELLQDEIGQQAGVLARRPKRSYLSIYNMKPDAFKKWDQGEFAQLQQMEKDYKKLFAKLTKEPSKDLNATAKKLYTELYATLQIYIWRMEHTVLLNHAIKKARLGRSDEGVGADEKSKRAGHIKEATDMVTKAEVISQNVIKKVAEIQGKIYRYPPDILSTKRKSLTSYPFGYLWETTTGHFWTRRDKQARNILKRASGEFKEEWLKPGPKWSFSIIAKEVELEKPSNGLIKQALGAFIPGFIFGIPEKSIGDGKTATSWQIAVDHNANNKPDAGTAALIEKGTIETKGGKTTFIGQMKLYQMPVIDGAGNSLGVLGLHELKIEIPLERKGNELVAFQPGTLRFNIVVENLLQVASQVDGIERDGLLTILGPILGFDPKSPPRDYPFEVKLKKFTKVTK